MFSVHDGMYISTELNSSDVNFLTKTHLFAQLVIISSLHCNKNRICGREFPLPTMKPTLHDCSGFFHFQINPAWRLCYVIIAQLNSPEERQSCYILSRQSKSPEKWFLVVLLWEQTEGQSSLSRPLNLNHCCTRKCKHGIEFYLQIPPKQQHHFHEPGS